MSRKRQPQREYRHAMFFRAFQSSSSPPFRRLVWASLRAMHLPTRGGIARLPAGYHQQSTVIQHDQSSLLPADAKTPPFPADLPAPRRRGAGAQERFSLFVPSDQENVERMLKLANLHDDDVVVDLGSGDGRIVLTAARMNPKVRGWGVDIDAKLVAESNAAAARRGRRRPRAVLPPQRFRRRSARGDDHRHVVLAGDAAAAAPGHPDAGASRHARRDQRLGSRHAGRPIAWTTTASRSASGSFRRASRATGAGSCLWPGAAFPTPRSWSSASRRSRASRGPATAARCSTTPG